MGERGVGGSKCGSTAAVALVFREGGATKLLAANVGDARVLLSRKGKAMQLTIDHVPDRHVSTGRHTWPLHTLWHRGTVPACELCVCQDRLVQVYHNSVQEIYYAFCEQSVLSRE